MNNHNKYEKARMNMLTVFGTTDPAECTIDEMLETVPKMLQRGS